MIAELLFEIAVRLNEKLLPKPQNPLVQDNFATRYREYLCSLQGCRTSGRTTGLPQATCWRCGRKTYFAADFVPEWRKPDED